MRKITQESVNAFINGEKFSKSNMQVVIPSEYQKYTILRLHGNNIARRLWQTIEISNAGWFSTTTKERLNGIPWVSIQQKKGTWYLNGVEWNGNWIAI